VLLRLLTNAPRGMYDVSSRDVSNGNDQRLQYGEPFGR